MCPAAVTAAREQTAADSASMTHVSDLKEDVLNIVFRHLSAEDLVTRVAPVCRNWYALSCLPPPPAPGNPPP